MQVETSFNDYLKLKQQLHFLKLTPAKQKRLHRALARKTRTLSRKRIREQRNIDGSPWDRRKGKSRKKMLKGMSKGMIAAGNAKRGLIYYKDNTTGRVARIHQDGIDQSFTPSKAKRNKRPGEPDYDANATQAQARALLDEGYMVRKRGKARRKPSQRWIRQNLTVGQAGLILRVLRGKPAKKNWTIHMPERSFLGVSREDVGVLYDEIIKQMAKQRR